MTGKDILRVGVAGSNGRVGRLLVQELVSGAWPGLVLGVAGTRDSAPEDVFDGTDVVIDFTAPEATARHVWLAAKHRRPIVVGTTGLNAAQTQELHDAARECPLLYAANMSVGVTLLAALVERAAAALPDWDIQIAETHHRNKKDAPSGTALMLGRAASGKNPPPAHAVGGGVRGGGRLPKAEISPSAPSLPPLSPLPLRGQGGEKVAERPVAYAVQRGGDVVGEHTVTFFGMGERLALSHIATDRALFARGALRAAGWLAGRPAGLYEIKNLLFDR